MFSTFWHPEQAGGLLTLRFVRINQGKGEIRPRDGDRNGTRSSGPVSIEIRGGTALFEPSAEGGTFNGVYFIGGEGSIAEVQEVLDLSFGAASIRTYGGRVSAFSWVYGIDPFVNACLPK